MKILALLAALFMASTVDAQVVKPKVADKKFWFVVGTLAVTKSFDSALVGRNTSRCYEANPWLGPYPSNARVAAVNGGYFAGEVAVAYVLKRIFRKHRWLGKLWAIEPTFQSGQHVYYSVKAFKEGCV